MDCVVAGKHDILYFRNDNVALYKQAYNRVQVVERYASMITPSLARRSIHKSGMAGTHETSLSAHFMCVYVRMYRVDLMINGNVHDPFINSMCVVDERIC